MKGRKGHGEKEGVKGGENWNLLSTKFWRVKHSETVVESRLTAKAQTFLKLYSNFKKSFNVLRI